MLWILQRLSCQMPSTAESFWVPLPRGTAQVEGVGPDRVAAALHLRPRRQERFGPLLVRPVLRSTQSNQCAYSTSSQCAWWREGDLTLQLAPSSPERGRTWARRAPERNPSISRDKLRNLQPSQPRSCCSREPETRREGAEWRRISGCCAPLLRPCL